MLSVRLSVALCTVAEWYVIGNSAMLPLDKGVDNFFYNHVDNILTDTQQDLCVMQPVWPQLQHKHL